MNSQTIEQLVFECGLKTPMVIVPAIALLLLCTWMLIRQRHVLGWTWVGAFWCLRAIALAVLVWMFLQPARVTETKSTLPQSVAVIVDNSDSMQVIDPEGEGLEVRWQLANTKADELAPRDAQVSLDSAIMALDVAEARWTEAQTQLQAGFDPTGLKKRFKEIAFALNRASMQLDDQFCERWTDADDRQRAREFASQSSELAEFATDLDLTESGDNSTKRIQRSNDSLQALVDLNRLVKIWSRPVSHAVAQSLSNATEAADRQTQVMQLVQEADKRQSSDTGKDNLSIKRFTFDSQLTPVLSTGGWSESSEGQEETDTTALDQPDESQLTTATNLTAAIQQIVQLSHSQSIRSAVFLTDGAHNAADAINPVEVAGKRSDVSISFVPIGSLKRPRDTQLYHVGHPRSVIVGDKIVIEAHVSAAGFEGQTIDLELRADGDLIEKKELAVDAEQMDLRHSFTVPTEQQGSIEFELKIKPLMGETSTTNNRSIFRVGVVQDKIRVMLADRISRWEYRYLDNLFERDEKLEHEMILFDPRLRATGRLEIDAALPVTLDAWSQYDVAIIGDLTPEEFPAQSQETLVEFVKEKGGIAILIAGRGGMPHAFEDFPLESLLPVQKSDSVVKADKYHVGVNRLAANLEAIRLNDSRAKSEELWQKVFEVQPITWLSEYSTLRPSARRLMDVIPIDDDGTAVDSDENEAPAWVCWQQLGAGRVVYLSAPDSYRLRYRRGDVLHHRFWAQMLRWITSDDPGSENGNVKLMTDKVRYTRKDSIGVTAMLSDSSGDPIEDAEVQATFEAGDGEPQLFVMTADQTKPGRYVAKVTGLSAGAYRVSLQGDVEDLLGEGEKVETFVNVITSPDVEQINTTCNRPLMKQIAQASGGYIIPPTALAEWLTLQTGMPETISQIDRVPLWNRWSSLWIAFGCLATEWCVRRIKGLT